MMEAKRIGEEEGVTALLHYFGYWLRGYTRHHAHDVEADRLVDSTNLLARDLMSAQPGTHQTNPDPRGIAGTTANDAADE